MPAIETLDWFIQQISPSVDEETRMYLTEQRQYFISFRSEDERRRFTEELMVEVKSKLSK